MTQLLSFKESIFPKLAGSTIESKSSTLLYYVFSGRNAWHSTWITRYSEGCMHPTLELAKNYAEKRRTQGTVFHIHELPAILFRTRNGCLIATQINSKNPLLNYLPNPFTTNLESTKLDMVDTLDSYTCINPTISETVLSFACGSRFWLTQPPTEDSVITVATNDPTASFAVLSNDNLQIRTSCSLGKKYLLGSPVKESGYSSSGVRNILAENA
ncbi:hypothetical protein ACIGCM_20805 [Pseudomonas sp. NPDC078700]|uniref:hypothetical protein n=1 Tax=Pseudomonas sp. NPDC078700 TaxID=3364424 RepID=UPI0037C4FAD5